MTDDVSVVFPAGHDSQLSEPSAKFVRPASQSVHSAAPAWLNLPMMHSEQLVAPSMEACLPASQESHHCETRGAESAGRTRSDAVFLR